MNPSTEIIALEIVSSETSAMVVVLMLDDSERYQTYRAVTATPVEVLSLVDNNPDATTEDVGPLLGLLVETGMSMATLKAGLKVMDRSIRSAIAMAKSPKFLYAGPKCIAALRGKIDPTVADGAEPVVGATELAAAKVEEYVPSFGDGDNSFAERRRKAKADHARAERVNELVASSGQSLITAHHSNRNTRVDEGTVVTAVYTDVVGSAPVYEGVVISDHSLFATIASTEAALNDPKGLLWTFASGNAGMYTVGVSGGETEEAEPEPIPTTSDPKVHLYRKFWKPTDTKHGGKWWQVTVADSRNRTAYNVIVANGADGSKGQSRTVDTRNLLGVAIKIAKDRIAKKINDGYTETT
ncbi:MAG: hypothetical protein CMB99_01295 [Flavobacteriaceae bacterium]|nr:hypothetical protein [Flavobacteriaceae bacterium]|tara:strand:- start:944 stop:2008 length:1065 start_codon:yes stop_codon:yes gene_type:complete